MVWLHMKTMFDYIVASLSLEFATEVCDLILKPPTEEPLWQVKEQLIKHMAASEQRRLQQLFNTEELGDCKPIQLLWRIQQLLGDAPGITDGLFISELYANDFMPTLPQSISTVCSSILSDIVEKLKGQLTTQTQLVKSLPFQCKSCTCSPSPTPPDSINANDTTVCWHHQKHATTVYR